MVPAFSMTVLNHSRELLWRAAAIMAIALAGVTGKIFAQTQPDQAVAPPSAPAQLSEDQLESLVAPIALYPDPLLTVMLPASVYPLEIVQAARFVQDTNNLPQLDAQSWDDNVKAVAKYPTVIKQMNDDLQWTIQLGNAFADQPMDVMNAIQTMRAKAQTAGTLQSTPEQIIIVTNAVVERTYQEQVIYVTNTVIEIQPANPQYVYVPTYNPVYVYYPPPGYVYYPIWIRYPVVITPYRCNWYYGGIYVGGGGMVIWAGRGPYHPPYYPCPPGYYRPPTYYPPPGYRPPPAGSRPPGYPNRPSTLPSQRPAGAGGATTLPANGGGQQWRPDPNRRPNTSAPSVGNNGPSRGWGGNAPSTGALGNRPATMPANGDAGNRPSYGNNPSPGTMPSNNRPSNGGSRPAQPPPSASQNNGNSAFNGVGNGNAARSSSNRGAASRGGGGGFRGGGGRR